MTETGHISYYGTCIWCAATVRVETVKAAWNYLSPSVHQCNWQKVWGPSYSIYPATHQGMKQLPTQSVMGPWDNSVARANRRSMQAQQIPDDNDALQAEYERLERQLLRIQARFDRVHAEIQRRKGRL